MEEPHFGAFFRTTFSCHNPHFYFEPSSSECESRSIDINTWWFFRMPRQRDGYPWTSWLCGSHCNFFPWKLSVKALILLLSSQNSLRHERIGSGSSERWCRHSAFNSVIFWLTPKRSCHRRSILISWKTLATSNMPWKILLSLSNERPSPFVGADQRV